MCPVKLSSARASTHGNEANSTMPIPPTQQTSRHATGRGWCTHAQP